MLKDQTIKLAGQVIQSASNKGLTTSTVESCTGGLISAALTEVSGSSSVFMGALITYSNDMKMKLAQVKSETLIEHGAVSKACALEMAKGGRSVTATDISISVTGIAGPTGGTDTKPVGLIHFGLSTKAGETHHKEVFIGSRQEVRAQTVHQALTMILEAIENE